MGHLGMSTTAEKSAIDPTFIRSRLGSLLAVLPLGLWTVLHLWSNLAAFQGAAAWQASVTDHAHPVAQLVTGLVVLMPLALHTVWGIGRLFTARPNNLRYGTFENFKYAIQRLSAVGLLFFLGAHLWLAMLHPRLVEGHAEAFEDISHQMHHHGPTLVVYLLGVTGVAYHLANGLATFALGWGLVTSKRAVRSMGAVSIAVFAAVAAVGYAAIFALWQAGA